MQINSLEFFKDTKTATRLDFDLSKLNLLALDDEEKKDTVFEALQQSLGGRFSQQKDRRQALSKTRLNLECRSSSFRLLSDLSKDGQSQRRIEPSEQALNQELHLNEDRQDQFGENEIERLFEIPPGLLESLCLISEEEGRRDSLLDSNRRLLLLGQFAGMSAESENIDKAIKLLDETLENYPFRGKNYHVDSLLTGISRGKVVLEERLEQLEKDREEASRLIAELQKLELELEETRKQETREEYFQLCLEAAELDSRIMKVQHRLMHESDLRRELAALGQLSEFPVELLRKVQDWWTMRQARISDLSRISAELKAQENELNARFQLELEDKTLCRFSLEDTQDLYGLARNISSLREELDALTQERDLEMRRVKEEGVDFDSISLVRKALLALPQGQLEEAYELSSQLRWQKDKLAGLVEQSQNNSKQIVSLEEEIKSAAAKSKQLKISLIVFAALAAIAGLALNFSGSSHILELLSTILLTSSVLSLFALAALPSLLSGFKRDLETKANSLNSTQQGYDESELDLSNEIAATQERAEEIARANEFAGAVELFKKLQTYSSISARLKQLDFLENILISRELNLQNLCRQGIEYLEKAGRKTTVLTPESLSGLASEIIRSKESLREFERHESTLNSRKSELRFLDGEIKELDALLIDAFSKAGIEEIDDLQKAYELFEEKSGDWRKSEEIAAELKRLSTTMTMEIFEDDLSVVLSKLKEKRNKAWERMQFLATEFADILSENIEAKELSSIANSPLQSLEVEIERKQKSCHDLRMRIRSILKNFDEFHPKTQHELEVLDRDLHKLKGDKESLQLASGVLKRVAQECKSSWSHELNELTSSMLSGSELEINKVKWSESLSLSLSLDPLSEETIDETQLQTSMSKTSMKMTNWILRLLLCRYVGGKLKLPLILDEPFSDLDDKRFAICMNFLLNQLLPHLQVLILSSQKARYDWFIAGLKQEDQERIKIMSAVEVEVEVEENGQN